MKVLFLLNIPSPYRVDYLNELSNYCELTVLYERKSSNERSSEWIHSENGNYEIVYLKTVKTSVNTGFSFEVLKYISKRGFDRIIVGGYSTPCSILAIIKMKCFRIPYILNGDGGMIQKESLFRRMVKRFLIGGASKYLSTGSETDKYFVYYGANPQSIYHYPFTSIRGSDIQHNMISREYKVSLKRELELPCDDLPIIIAVGQFIRRKGFDLLLSIWNEKNIPAHLLLIGDGPLRNQYCQNSNKNVIIEGFKTKEELSKYYLASDIFVLPTREDIWGLVINEAMAYGLPIISTYQCIAACELIKNGENGFLVQSDDIIAMTKAIQCLINEKEMRYEMGKKNLEKIKGYTIEEMAKVTYKILCL